MLPRFAPLMDGVFLPANGLLHLMKKRMVGFDNRSGFAFGDTLLAMYELPGEEKPVPKACAIVSSGTFNQQRSEVVVMAIAVQPRPDASSGEIAVLQPEAAGLEKGSAFKPVLATVPQRLVRLILGHLGDDDRQQLRHLLDLFLGD